jgi:ABC-type transporter Mla subunit MlaD
VLGLMNQDIDIPKDSIASIRSDGLFGKKSILINPGFDIPFDSSNKNITFMETSDSYSIDMFLRYLKNLNE